MPRTYEKGKSKPWREEDMKKALNEVAKGESSIRAAAKKHSLSESVSFLSFFVCLGDGFTQGFASIVEEIRSF